MMHDGVNVWTWWKEAGVVLQQQVGQSSALTQRDSDGQTLR